MKALARKTLALFQHLMPAVAAAALWFGVGFAPAAQAAIAVVASSSASTTSGDLTIAKPSGTAAGHVMIATVARVTSNKTVSAPSGWTEIQETAQGSGGTSTRLYSFYKIAGTSEPADYTFTIQNSSGVNSVGGIIAFSGVDSTSPVQTSAEATTASSTSHAAPAVTTTSANTMLVTAHEFASSSSWTAPSGMTEQVDVASQAAGANGISLSMNTMAVPSAGSSGPHTAVAAGNADNGATHSVVLKETTGCSTWRTKVYLNEYYYSTGGSSGFLELYSSTTGFAGTNNWYNWKVETYSADGAPTSYTFNTGTATACTLKGKMWVTYPTAAGTLTDKDALVILKDSSGAIVDAFLYAGNDAKADDIFTLYGSNLAACGTLQTELQSQLTTLTSSTTTPYLAPNVFVDNAAGNKDMMRVPDGGSGFGNNWTSSLYTGSGTTYTQCTANNGNLTKTVSATQVAQGASFSYTIKITNSSNATISNASVEDVLPGELTTAPTATATAGTPTVVNGSPPATPHKVTWTIPSLAKGATATLTITATVPGTTPIGTILINEAKTTGGISPQQTDVATTEVVSANTPSFKVAAPATACNANDVTKAPQITVTAYQDLALTVPLTTYTGSITLSTSDGLGTWYRDGTTPTALSGGQYTFVAGDNGVATFKLVHTTATTISVQTTDNIAVPTMTGTPTNNTEFAAAYCGGAASFLVVPSATTASSCGTVGGSPPSPYVTITAKDGAGGVGNTVTGYTGTITLSGYGRGVWSIKTGAGTLTTNTYTFAAADQGVVELYLTDGTAETVTPSVTDGTASGTSTGSIAFSDNVLIVEDGDTKNGTVTPDYTVVAGRAHLVYASVYKKTGSTCGLNTGFSDSAAATTLWLTPTTGSPGTHPSGATLPTASTAANCSGAVSLASSKPGATNFTLNYASGRASFYLCTTDVGQYQVSAETNALPGSVKSASSSAFTAVPFAVAVSAVKQGSTENPAGTLATDSVFAKAGTAFQATVGGYLWQSAADANNDGLPDAGATSSQVLVSTLPRYAQTVTLSAASPYTPAGAGGTLGTLVGGGVSVTGGSATPTTLQYSEVGSFSLAATPAGNYLGAVDLSSRVLIYAKPSSTSQNAVVGRFTPDHFDTVVTGPMVCSTLFATGCPTLADGTTLSDRLAYSGQGVPVTVTAYSALGTATSNYTTALGFAKTPVTLAAYSAVGGATASSGIALASNSVSTMNVGGAASPAPTFTFSPASNPPASPVNLYIRATDAEGVSSSRDTNPTTTSVEGGVKIVGGRLRLASAFGSEALPLTLPAYLEYWNGTYWATNTADSSTALATSASAATGSTTGEACFGTSGTCPHAGMPDGSLYTSTTASAIPVNTKAIPSLSGGGTASSGTLSITLSAPGTGSTGTVKLSVKTPPWLQVGGADAWANATFGVYNSNAAKRFIYRRESY